MPLIAITRLRIRGWRFMPAFALQSVRTFMQARRAPGNLATDALNDAHRTFWTRTAWIDEAAMRDYMRSAPHGPVMRRLAEWCDEASVAHWAQESAEPPDWREVHRRMQQDGRPSRVLHPTDAHTAFRIPEPRLGQKTKGRSSSP